MLTRSGLDIVVGRALGTVVLTVRGALVGQAAADLLPVVEEVLPERPERLVIDLSRLSALDDEGIAVLERASAAAKTADVQLQLTSRARSVLSRLRGRDVDVV